MYNIRHLYLYKILDSNSPSLYDGYSTSDSTQNDSPLIFETEYKPEIKHKLWISEKRTNSEQLKLNFPIHYKNGERNSYPKQIFKPKTSLDIVSLQYETNELTIYDEFLEKYQILDLLGKGEQGSVYKVQDKINNQFFAAKKILISDNEILKMVENELLIIKKLKNDGIIKVFNSYIDTKKNIAMIVMEYFEGQNLMEYITNNIEKITEEDIKKIMKQLFMILETLHSNGIIHRDLTLNNILISSEGKIKLVDFGLAKSVIKNLGKSYSPVGKFKTNRPPEFSKEGFYTLKYDIWCCGLIMFQMFFKKLINSKQATEIVQNFASGKDDDKFSMSKEMKEFSFFILDSCSETRYSSAQALSHAWLANIN